MKKGIVIVTRQMVMGGIEKSLISLIESIPQNDYEVTVLVMAKGGELFENIPPWVNIRCLYGDETSTIQKLLNCIKRGKFLTSIKILWYTIVARNSKNVFKQEMYHTKIMPIENEVYDIAISYHVPASLPVVYVINNIKAKQKIAWIHSDVSIYKRELIPYKEFYDKYDRVYCVSKYGRDKFIELYPNLKEKVDVFYNMINKTKLQTMGNNAGFNDVFNGIRILTIGRLTHEKGQDIIPNIVKKLKEIGLDIRWYCIGDGIEKIKLENKIQKIGLDEDIILLGTHLNPYPFIKECDIYVQPSRHEGYCITLAEARLFNKPIITTNTIGAREQIINEVNGLIVEFDENQIYKSINRLIKDKELIKKLKINLSKENNKIYSIID